MLMKRILAVLLVLGVGAGFVATVGAGVVGCGDDDGGTADASPVDAGGCAACAGNQVCVQRFTAACTGGRPTCVTSTLACPAATCQPDCEREICGLIDGGVGPTCKNRILCGGEVRDSFTCYGP
jgi:hypothetical protein